MKNKLNPESRLASFYRYFYLTSKLPNNLCNYFWALLFAFIVLPFVWIAVLINYMSNKITRNTDVLNIYKDGKHVGTKNVLYYYVNSSKIETPYGIVFVALAMAIGGFTIEKLLGLKLANIGLGILNTFNILFLTGLVTVLTGILIFYVLMGLYQLLTLLPKELTAEEKAEKERKRLERETKRWEKERKENNNPNFLVLAWRWVVAFKEKNCPILEWDYEIKPTDENTKL